MKRILCASMMCANYGHLASEVRALDDAGVDFFHCDIMDGSFVPNFTMGVTDVATIRRCTKKKVDCHLMIENPGDKVDWFIDAGADIMYIHPESEHYVVKTLAHIRGRGASPGLAINPDTSIASVEEMLGLCDYLMVMTVNPGFAGQGFIDFTRKKVQQLVELKGQYGYKLMIDGHCTPEIVEDLANMGVDGFILGTSALFRKGRTYAELMTGLRGKEAEG